MTDLVIGEHYTDEWGEWEVTGEHARILVAPSALFEEKRVSRAMPPVPNPLEARIVALEAAVAALKAAAP